jgi:hypothetical protein
MYAYTLKYWVSEYSPPITRKGLPYTLACDLATWGKWYKTQVISPEGGIVFDLTNPI